MAVTVAPNCLIALVALTFPLFLILHPIARKAGVVWDDPRGDATKVGWARFGRAMAWFAMLVCAVVGFIMYRGAADSLTTLALSETVILHLCFVQAPLVLLCWLGMLIG